MSFTIGMLKNTKRHIIDERYTQKMSGVYLTGHGGLEKLVYKEDIPVPTPKSGEVLIKVNGAGVNNTDINTRLGWYSKRVTSDTNQLEKRA